MDSFSLPFLTREMLKFEQSTKFSLVVHSQSDTARVILINGATRSGQFTVRHTTTNTGSLNTESFAIPDVPIWISVKNVSDDALPNETYVQVSLALNDNVMQPLCAGYLYGVKAISWPNTNIERPTPESWGHPKATFASAPAAGAEFSWSPISHTLLQIQAVTFTLTTSATVANRRVHLRFVDGGVDILDFHASIDQTASQTRLYTCAAIGGAGSYAHDNDIIIPIPPNLTFESAVSIQSSTVGLQAGDQFSGINISRVEKRSTQFS